MNGICELNAAEMTEVEGGILPILGAFFAGMIVGECIAGAYYLLK